ncbi:MAG: hypothetical protein ACR5LA_11800 [Wolbachia sp.]
MQKLLPPGIRSAGWQNEIDKNIGINGVMKVADTGIQSFCTKNVYPFRRMV